MPVNQSFNIGWRYIAKKELPANMYRNSEVGFIVILFTGFGNDYVRGNQFRKVVHNESSKDFLVNVLHFFA